MLVRLLMFVMSKSKKARSFSGIRHLPCRYWALVKSWTSGQLFEKWLYVLDNQFHQEGWKIVMIIDHCPAHLHLENLKSVVRSLKTKYGTIFTRRIIIALDNSKAILKFNILEAMCMLTRAWDLVSTTTILKYFKKLRLQPHHRLKLSIIPTTHLVISNINSRDLTRITRRDSSLL